MISQLADSVAREVSNRSQLTESGQSVFGPRGATIRQLNERPVWATNWSVANDCLVSDFRPSTESLTQRRLSWALRNGSSKSPKLDSGRSNSSVPERRLPTQHAPFAGRCGNGGLWKDRPGCYESK